MRVLTWNLFHGRTRPPSHRARLADFAAAIASWEWDVALLQEVPPWWPPTLARASGAAAARTALTSRNLGLPLRRSVAVRDPDLIKSNGGGANAVLLRAEVPHEHVRLTLRRRPERRVAHGVRLADGTWVVNLHAQVHSEARAQADLARAATGGPWAGAERLVLGGDTNTRRPRAPGLEVAGGHDVDFVLHRGFRVVSRPQPLEHGALSDHAPVICELVPGVAS